MDCQLPLVIHFSDIPSKQEVDVLTPWNRKVSETRRVHEYIRQTLKIKRDGARQVKKYTASDIQAKREATAETVNGLLESSQSSSISMPMQTVQ